MTESAFGMPQDWTMHVRCFLTTRPNADNRAQLDALAILCEIYTVAGEHRRNGANNIRFDLPPNVVAERMKMSNRRVESAFELLCNEDLSPSGRAYLLPIRDDRFKVIEHVDAPTNNLPDYPQVGDK